VAENWDGQAGGKGRGEKGFTGIDWYCEAAISSNKKYNKISQ
jgi:hypothetical protein